MELSLFEQLKKGIFYNNTGEQKSIDIVLKNIKYANLQNYEIDVVGECEYIREDEPYAMDYDGIFILSHYASYTIKSNSSKGTNKTMSYDEFTNFISKNENISQDKAYNHVRIFADNFAKTYHDSGDYYKSFNANEFGFTISPN